MSKTSKLISLMLVIVMMMSVFSVGVVATSAAVEDAAADKAIVTLYGLFGQTESREFNVGDTFTVYTYMNTKEVLNDEGDLSNGAIGALKGQQVYDADKLQLNDEVNARTGAIKDLAGMYPITGTRTVAKGSVPGTITFTASTPNSYEDCDFIFDSDDSGLIFTHYTVTAPGQIDIYTTFSELAVADYVLTRLIVNGEFTQEFKLNSYFDPYGTVTGHTYELIDGVLKCKDCGELFNGEYIDGKLYVDGIPAAGWVENKYYVDGEYVTGIVEIDGKYYEFDENGESQGVYTGLVQDDEDVWHYSKLGELAGGWFEVEGEWYYFDTETLAPVAEKTFTYPNSKAVTTYQFEENGKIVDGVWVELALGTRYYYGPDYYKLVAQQGNVKWAEIDGNTYGFSKDGYRHEGISVIKESNNPRRIDKFTDDGVWEGPYTGIYEGYYYTDGYKDTTGMGLTAIDGDYYYIQKSGKLDVSTSRYLNDEMTKGYVTAGVYEFDEEGKMILKQGIVDGFYYENGSLVKGKGLISYEGSYYFVKVNGSIYKDASLYVAESKANGLVPAGLYEFDADGKMLLKNGVIDGSYYENGVLAKGAGLIKWNDALYYVKKSGQVDISTSRYFNEEMCKGLITPGLYYFDADGKMIIKNGVVDGFYYENGNLIKGKGLVEFNGDIYFVKVTGAIYTNNSLFVAESKTNGIKPAGLYYFDADGKMILD